MNSRLSLHGCHVIASSLVVAVAIGFSALSSAATITTPADEGYADELYARAQAVLASESYPPDIDYLVVIETNANGKTSTNHYSGEVMTETQDCRVEAFSKEEQADPYTPRGINVGYSISISVASGAAPVSMEKAPNATILSGPISKPSPPTDLLGIPELTPTYSFALRPGRPLDIAPLKEGPSVIGRVSSHTVFYKISIVGTETVEGSEATHLRFQPLKEPGRYRLRDLWVLSSDYWPARARVFGNFTTEPETSVPWLIRFIRIDGATYIDTETAEQPLRRGKRTFDSAVVRFENIHPHHGPRNLRFVVPLVAEAPGRLIEPEQLVSTPIRASVPR